MKLEVGSNILEICREIVEEGWSDAEWAKNESGDWFQYNDIVGGYDADEQAFLFSYYDIDEEWWLEFRLSDVPKILCGEIKWLKLSVPKR
jgi:hypothetical protein